MSKWSKKDSSNLTCIIRGLDNVSNCAEIYQGTNVRSQYELELFSPNSYKIKQSELFHVHFIPTIFHICAFF